MQSVLKPLQVSLEFFAPSNENGRAKMMQTMQNLADYWPCFVSVTDAAGGKVPLSVASSRSRDALQALKTVSPNVPRMAHLVVSGRSQVEIAALLEDYKQQGVKQILVLRGDRQGASSQDLLQVIEHIAKHTNFSVAVAGYPETHPKAKSQAEDLAFLKRKTDAGASLILTQFFFDNEYFYRYRDACQANGIHTPIGCGVISMERFEQIQQFAQGCGTHIPERIVTRFQRAAELQMESELAAAYLSGQCADLLKNDVTHLHFFTMNRYQLTQMTLDALSVSDIALPWEAYATAFEQKVAG